MQASSHTEVGRIRLASPECLHPDPWGLSPVYLLHYMAHGSPGRRGNSGCWPASFKMGRLSCDLGGPHVRIRAILCERRTAQDQRDVMWERPNLLSLALEMEGVHMRQGMWVSSKPEKTREWIPPESLQEGRQPWQCFEFSPGRLCQTSDIQKHKIIKSGSLHLTHVYSLVGSIIYAEAHICFPFILTVVFYQVGHLGSWSWLWTWTLSGRWEWNLRKECYHLTRHGP